MVEILAETKEDTWEYMKELYKKDLNESDNHDGMVSYLEPGILECEVKWALGSTISIKLVEMI